MNGLSLFTGIGGLDVALSEWVRPIAYCEIDSYCQGVLLSRMSKNELHTAPIWDDITNFYPEFSKRSCDIIFGGFPCQDISIAGHGKGLAGERSGLFFEILRLAKEIKPKFIFLENVPAITSRGGLRVVREIAEMGYDCRWCVISAASVGALHKRERWFLLAHANNNGSLAGEIGRSPRECPISGRQGKEEQAQGVGEAQRTSGLSSDVADTRCFTEGSEKEPERPYDQSTGCRGFWEVEPALGGTLDGLSAWLDKNNMMLIKSHKCIMSYVEHLGENGQTSKENRRETLRTLRNNLQQEIDRESIGGFFGISAKKVLFSYLCKLEETSETLGNLSSESAEVQESILRSLWAQKKFTGASHRSRLQKQREREHPDSLQTLSRLLAYDSEEAWIIYRWENAESLLNTWSNGWEDGISRLTDETLFRVDRLRALGNSVVPAQAKEAFKILMGLK